MSFMSALSYRLCLLYFHAMHVMHGEKEFTIKAQGLSKGEIF